MTELSGRESDRGYVPKFMRHLDMGASCTFEAAGNMLLKNVILKSNFNARVFAIKACVLCAPRINSIQPNAVEGRG